MIPKIIWILWFQGWENAPDLVKIVRQTWYIHNPDWIIMSLDESNLRYYLTNYPLPNTTIQAKSDIIRLDLLSTYGGVWADATMACMQPLDPWVEQATGPSGFWMYHGRDKGRGPASWFMMSRSDSYIINKWNEICKRFWGSNPWHIEYFWMDRLFAYLAINDSKFLEEWKKVPFLDCSKYGSAHCVGGRAYLYDREVIDYIRQNPPFAIKLCSRGQLYTETNAWQVLHISLTNTKTIENIQWDEPPNYDNANFFAI